MTAAVLQPGCFTQPMTRLATFSDFPVKDVFVSKLSTAGLYSTKSGKEVKCAYCSFTCNDWNTTEDLFHKHHLDNRNCQFTRPNEGRIAPVISKPVFSGSGQSDEEQPENNTARAMPSLLTDNKLKNSQDERQSVLGGLPRSKEISKSFNQSMDQATSSWTPSTIEEKKQALTGLGISIARPKYSKYAILSTRVSSFEHWPSHLKQKPQDLAAAGFYYRGPGDHVQCFYCGGGLTEWEEDDDPWVEHAHWFPDCIHLYNCKGSEFIQNIQKQLANKDVEPILLSENSLSTDCAESDENCTSFLCSSDKSSGPSPLDTIAVQSILETGYNLEIVERAVDVWTTRNKSKSFTATDLIELIFEIEEGSNTCNDSECSASRAPQNHEFSNNSAAETNKNDPRSSTFGLNDCMTQESTEENQRIVEENKEMKERMLCKVCMDETVSVVFLPCGHLVTCSQCAPAMRRCPICRANIKRTVKAYI